MLEFAESLTLDPGNSKSQYVAELRSHGWTDEDVVDIVHITCLFNYLDRVADGLGAELDPSRGWQTMAEKLSFLDQSTPKAWATRAGIKDMIYRQRQGIGFRITIYDEEDN